MRPVKSNKLKQCWRLCQPVLLTLFGVLGLLLIANLYRQPSMWLAWEALLAMCGIPN
ncbi:hypothetical protein [Parvibium lacunae]|uniref:hypothetical protein n=1 Tax=Parvibium lacunae TaxID=1888893 RepID=UPI00131479FC|nr:hypothetical protein [Parvibium lacunae]